MKRIVLALTMSVASLSVSAEQILTDEDFKHLNTPSAYCEYLASFAYETANDRDVGVSEGDTRGYVSKWVRSDGMLSAMLGTIEIVYAYPRQKPSVEQASIYGMCMESLEDQ